MAVPVVASSASTTFATASSVVITKPTGVALGDYLVAGIFYADSGSGNSITAPAGWASVETVDMPDSFRRLYVFSKVATATEVAASNFTFTSSVSCTIGGAMLRITGVVTEGTHEQDSYNSSTTTAISFTANRTPASAEALVIMILAAWDITGSNDSLSGYASTPSKTWTEVIDIGNQVGSDLVMGIATATSGNTSQITNYSATISAAKGRHAGVLLLINPPIDATGSVSFQTVTTTMLTSGGMADAVSSNSLVLVSSVANINSGEADSPTRWTNTDKPTDTEWQNTNK